MNDLPNECMNSESTESMILVLEKRKEKPAKRGFYATQVFKVDDKKCNE